MEVERPSVTSEHRHFVMTQCGSGTKIDKGHLILMEH